MPLRISHRPLAPCAGPSLRAGPRLVDLFAQAVVVGHGIADQDGGPALVMRGLEIGLWLRLHQQGHGVAIQRQRQGVGVGIVIDDPVPPHPHAPPAMQGGVLRTGLAQRMGEHLVAGHDIMAICANPLCTVDL